MGEPRNLIAIAGFPTAGWVFAVAQRFEHDVAFQPASLIGGIPAAGRAVRNTGFSCALLGPV